MKRPWRLAAAAAVSPQAAAFDVQAHWIREPVAAVYTPMAEGGLELDLDRVPAYAELLAARNVTNVLAAGTNGESLSLSAAERERLAEAWAQAAPRRGLKVYVHVGSESLADAVELARHAAETVGISGIFVMSPVYFKPTMEALHELLAAVAAAAPGLPLWFYHYPAATGVLPGQAHELLELAERSGRIPTLTGVKFTDSNLMDLQLCVSLAAGKYNVLNGIDYQALAGLTLGAATTVSSTVQYSPTLRRALALHARGDAKAAAAAQLENARLCSQIAAYEAAGLNVQKSLMRMSGLDVGPSRLPKQDLPAADFMELEERLAGQGLLDRPAAPAAEGLEA